MRTAIKYFTIGFLAGLLLAPRKGDETRKLLIERGKEYVQEVLNVTEQAAEQAQQQVREAQQRVSQA
jgi:gas vesicle protein